MEWRATVCMTGYKVEEEEKEKIITGPSNRLYFRGHELVSS